MVLSRDCATADYGSFPVLSISATADLGLAGNMRVHGLLVWVEPQFFPSAQGLVILVGPSSVRLPQAVFWGHNLFGVAIRVERGDFGTRPDRVHAYSGAVLANQLEVPAPQLRIPVGLLGLPLRNVPRVVV